MKDHHDLSMNIPHTTKNRRTNKNYYGGLGSSGYGDVSNDNYPRRRGETLNISYNNENDRHRLNNK